MYIFNCYRMSSDARWHVEWWWIVYCVRILTVVEIHTVNDAFAYVTVMYSSYSVPTGIVVTRYPVSFQRVISPFPRAQGEAAHLPCRTDRPRVHCPHAVDFHGRVSDATS